MPYEHHFKFVLQFVLDLIFTSNKNYMLGETSSPAGPAMTRPATSTQRRRKRNSESKPKIALADEQPRQDPLIERALIIRPEPLKWILSAKKVWEIRSKPTRIRGPIALQEKGTKQILGTCALVDCLGPLTVDEFISNAHKMNYAQAELEDERKELEEDMAYGLYAWVLADAKALPKPIRFQNPSGAVTWVRLPQRVMNKLLTT